MDIYDHDHDHPSEFEAGCPACELNEVSLQDTGRSWASRAIKHPAHAANPLPVQSDRRTA